MEWPYPTVRHLIVCRRPNPVDAAYREAVLRVVFALRPMAGAAYPFRLPELHVFAQVAGGAGTFEFAVDLFRMDADPALVVASAPVEFTFDDRVAAYSFFRGFRMIPFERAGLYEFHLFARMVRTPTGDAVTHARRLLTTEVLRMETGG